MNRQQYSRLVHSTKYKTLVWSSHQTAFRFLGGFSHDWSIYRHLERYWGPYNLIIQEQQHSCKLAAMSYENPIYDGNQVRALDILKVLREV